MNVRDPFCSYHRRPARRLAALLCLTACGGFLFGTFRERAEKHNATPSAPLLASPSSGEPTGDLLAGNAFIAPAAQAMQDGDYERALGYYRAALTDAKTDQARHILADKLHTLGISAHMQDKGQGRSAVAALEEALTLYRRLNAAPETASTLADLADAVLLKGDTARAQECWTEAMQIAPHLKEETQADLWLRAGDFSLSVGRYSDAKDSLNRVLNIQRRRGDVHAMGHALRYLGTVASDTGDYTLARRQLEESARLLQSTGDLETRAAVLGTWGDVLLRTGRTTEAIPLYKEGLAVWKSRKQRYWTAVFQARLGEAAYRQGQQRAAGELCRESLSLLETSNGPVGRIRPLTVLGHLARQQGNTAEALRLHQEAQSLREKLGNPRFIAEGKEALALDTAALNDSAHASALMAEAARLRNQAGTPLPPADRVALNVLLIP